MASRERFAGDGPSPVRTLDNALNLLLVPGVVVHEVAHAVACLLVGVEIREVVFFEWSLADIRTDQPFTARVTHAPADATWKATAIGVAPLVVNAALGLLAFRAIKLLLRPVGPLDAAPGVAVAAYRDALAVASPPELVAVGLCTWIGTATAMTAVPSVNDALVTAGPGDGNEGDSNAEDEADASDGSASSSDDAETADLGVAGPLVAAGFLLENFQSELGVVLVTVLAAVGLVGPDLALAFWETYLAVFGVGLAYLLYRRWRREGRSLLEVPAAESQRADLLRQRVEAGRRPSEGAVAALLGQLDHHRWLVRQATLRALLAIARERPEHLAPHRERLVERHDAEPVTDGQLLLLQILAELVETVDDRTSLARLGAAEVRADREDLDVAATKLLAWIAIEDPAPVADRADALLDAFPGLAPKARTNAAIALDEVANADPAALTGRADRLGRLAEDSDGEAVEYLEQALADVRAAEQPPSGSAE